MNGIILDDTNRKLLELHAVCLIVFAYRIHPRYPLVLLANRDEYYDRPSLSAEFWPQAPDLLAGRDLKGQGTWLGLTRAGRFATVTNFRNPAAPVGTQSRGRLVADFLLKQQTGAQAYAEQVQQQMADYSGFNLLVGDLEQLCYLSNRSPAAEVRVLRPGLYGISNHLLDSPWPKLERAKALLREQLDHDQLVPERLLSILLDRQTAPDHALPDTGIGLVKERLLSSIFIADTGYGTRASTLVLLSNSGQVEFVEQSFGPAGVAGERKQFSFPLQASGS